jgi:hypothetical protein
MRFHAQNLNDKPGGRVGLMLRHGRCWLHIGRTVLKLSWQFPSSFCHADVSVLEHDEAFGLSFACWLFAVWFGVENWKFGRVLKALFFDAKDYEGREIKIGLHDGAIWWSLWCPSMSWSSRTPKWRSGAFHPIDFLFGRPEYSKRVIANERGVVPMPEGPYPCTVQLYEATWKRARLPWVSKRVMRADLKPDTPIAHPGKGENSYDCGEDASFNFTLNAKTVLEACMAAAKSVLRDRIKHGSGFAYRPQKQWVQR